MMVSPGFGRASHFTTMSMFRLPTTAMSGFTGPSAPSGRTRVSMLSAVKTRNSLYVHTFVCQENY
jgi:hypothetical protein